MPTGWRNLKGCDQFKALGIDTDHIIIDVKKWNARAWCDFTWLGLRASGGLL
jgi:hypothetical protein